MDAPLWRYYVRLRRPTCTLSLRPSTRRKSVVFPPWKNSRWCGSPQFQVAFARSPKGRKNTWTHAGWKSCIRIHPLNPSQIWLYALKGARDLRETAQHYAGLPFWILIEFPPLCRPFSFLRIWFLVLFFLLFGLFFLRILYTFVYDNYYKSISYSSYT